MKTRMFFLHVTCVALLLAPVIHAEDVPAPQLYVSPWTVQNVQGTWADEITTIHERCHEVNSRLRNRWGKSCLYVGDKKFAWLPKARGTLAQVANASQYRGDLFQLYLIQQQQHWNDDPMYLFDEWVCYANGAAVAVYGKPVPGQHWSDVQYACEMGYYCRIVADQSGDKEIMEFWRWHAKKCVKIADDAERKQRNYRQTVKPWREWLRGRIRR